MCDWGDLLPCIAKLITAGWLQRGQPTWAQSKGSHSAAAGRQLYLQCPIPLPSPPLPAPPLSSLLSFTNLFLWSREGTRLCDGKRTDSSLLAEICFPWTCCVRIRGKKRQKKKSPGHRKGDGNIIKIKFHGNILQSLMMMTQLPRDLWFLWESIQRG